MAQESTARGMLFYGRSVLVSAAVGEPFWILPRGHIDPGETSLQALRREWHEEVGITLATVRAVQRIKTTWRRGGQLHGDLVEETLHLFLVTTSMALGDGVMRFREDWLRFRWVPVGELLRAPVVPLEVIPWIIHSAGGGYG